MKNLLLLGSMTLMCLSINAQQNIKLTIDGKTRFVFDSSRMALLNDNNNIFIGDSTGYLTTQGFGNVALGSRGLRNNLFGSGNIAIGVEALFSNKLGDANIAIGSYTMRSGENSSGNLAIGNAAMANNTSGGFNVALGHSALNGITTGSCNVAVGSVALQNNTLGSDNVAIGDNALRNDTIGMRNVAIGRAAMSNNYTGSNNIAIGYFAGENETGSNKLYIENSNSVTPLIYGEFDNDIVRVNGELQIDSSYRFPVSAGALNQILKTDGTGQLSWQNDNIDDADANPTNELLDSAILNYPFLELYEGGLPPYMVDLGLLIDDADADASNELQLLSKSGNSVTLSNGGGTVSIDDDDADISNELIDSLVLAYPFLEIHEGGGPAQVIDLNALVDDADADPANELQSLSTSGDSIFISNGNGIKLPTPTITTMIDADADTKLELIENGATDIIGFTVDGKQILGVDSSRIQFFNNGENTLIGKDAAKNINGGSSNTILGMEAGRDLTSGSRNTFVGHKAGIVHSTGNDNTFVGRGAGLLNANGSRNVFIGNDAGGAETGSDKLYIDNSNTANALIYGEFDTDSLQFNANLRFNTVASSRDIIIGSYDNGSTVDPAIRPSQGNWGYLGDPTNYFYEGYINEVFANTYSTLSDRRIKENIRPISHALETVKLLQGVSYDLIASHHNKGKLLSVDKENKRFDNIGFIAQEVEEILPQLVHTQDGTGLKSVNYTGLIPVMLEAIKQQQEIIDKLERRILALENE